MNILVKATKMEWEGMSYVAIHGDINNFKDPYIILKNKQNDRECASIIKTMSPSVNIK